MKGGDFIFMDSEALRSAKRSARKTAREQLKAISPEKYRQIGASMLDRLLTLSAWQRAESVFCFVSAGNEPDTYPILQTALQEGKVLYVPRITGPGQMETVAITSLLQLVPGEYNIPAPDSSLPASPDAAPALALLPCLAATQQGARLGHGGGYYDRFLENYSGVRILLCPQALLQESLPTGPLDQPAHAVLTECDLFGCLPTQN